MTQYAFYFDSNRCSGCKTCEIACKDYNNLGVDYTFRRICDYEGGEWVEDADGGMSTTSYVYHVSVACNHCDNPACVKVCPTAAMGKDSDTGLVSVDSSKCIGCGYCHMACPYNAPTVDSDLGCSTKCDGCISRVKEGKEPICVEACLLRCLYFGPVGEIENRGGERANVAPLPAASVTSPNFFLKPNDCHKPVDDATGWLANPKEVM